MFHDERNCRLASRVLNLMKLALPVMVAGLGCAAPALAQSPAATPLDVASTLRISSAALGEERLVDVALPESYGRGERRYPVLIVLDAESQFLMASGLARFYGAVGALPEMIVVGVRTVDRNRDLTTAPVPGFQHPIAGRVGGADRFLGFVTTELLPLLDREYRTTPMRVIAGHSLGGLFVLHALASSPQAFTGYVVLEPSAWWNDRREFLQARTVLATPAGRRARVVLVNAPPTGLDTTRWGGSAAMVREFATTGEEHATMPVPGLSRGLRTIFADFLPTDWRPGTRPIAMLARYDTLAERVGYQVPVPAATCRRVAEMSIQGRFFDDAETALTRLELTGDESAARALRSELAQARAAPPPADFIALEIPARRPTAGEAGALLGRWRGRMGSPNPQVDSEYELEVRADGDTIAVTGHQRFANGERRSGPLQVIRAAGDSLVWALPLRGVPGVVAYVAHVAADGALEGFMQIRGIAPPPEWRTAGGAARQPRFRLERVGS